MEMTKREFCPKKNKGVFNKFYINQKGGVKMTKRLVRSIIFFIAIVTLINIEFAEITKQKPPIYISHGFNAIEEIPIFPENDRYYIYFNPIREKRITIDLRQTIVSSSKLPIGANIDMGNGIFYWMPGPVVKGEFQIKFKILNGEEKSVIINLSLSTKLERVFSNTSIPFGNFDTPVDGSMVSGSIPITGWALDDNGIANVKIYLNDGINMIFIGDAILVEGARPDVAEEYPGYPNNTKAGWGYMLLTNLLPGNGNGTFEIIAIATDMNGNHANLGTKTIHCDNANATKPFGTIDSPTQGGNSSGSQFINWGWVLTPQPNNIPPSGSTINVWVNGINLGNPTYNIYREDIATILPGYANSNGAVGFFYLDTTQYTNGMHTISWTAADSAGNREGIGSRYFLIKNPENFNIIDCSVVLNKWDLKGYWNGNTDQLKVNCRGGYIGTPEIIWENKGISPYFFISLELSTPGTTTILFETPAGSIRYTIFVT